MKPQERIDYSPINERPPLKLPEGARLAIWVIVNVEEWDIQQTMPRSVLPPPAGSSALPDIPNWAWHEYGNRVGFWRMLEVLDRFEIRAGLAVNGRALRGRAASAVEDKIPVCTESPPSGIASIALNTRLTSPSLISLSMPAMTGRAGAN